MTAVPEPFHEWTANSDPDVRPFGLRDRCTVCGVLRQSHLAGERRERSDAVANGPCPQRPWRELDDEALAPYLEAWRS